MTGFRLRRGGTQGQEQSENHDHPQGFQNKNYSYSTCNKYKSQIMLPNLKIIRIIIHL
jgi:hypothetical protein